MKVLGMLPGVGAALKNIDLDDNHFKRIEAMIQSMTPKERRTPSVIDVQRRRRIAAGSGNPLDAVNGLIKQFKAMQDMMKKLGKGGLGGMMAATPPLSRLVLQRKKETKTAECGADLAIWSLNCFSVW